MKKRIIFLTLFVLLIYVISFAGKCAYSQLPIGTGNKKLRIFVTSVSTNGFLGALGGIAGADALCAGDANNPGGGIFKAMIMSPSRHLSLDWVLQPDTKYYRTDGTTFIGQTGPAKIFIFPLSNQIETSLHQVWTGMDGAGNPHSDNCNGWTDDGGFMGARGNSNSLNTEVYNNSSDPCNMPLKLYCVEQP